MKVSEIQCKQILVKSNLPSADYTMNPYLGCGHGCCYCYARFMMRFMARTHKEKWGEFVDVKINAPEVLKKQLEKAKKGVVVMSSVTDCYQPLEKKYKITRQLVNLLLEKQFPLSIMTKSDLVLRDLDLFKQFKKVSLGFTINTLDETFRSRIEKKSSPTKDRLAALKTISKNGIPTFAMIGPCFPFFTDVEKIISKLHSAGVTELFAERLNTNGENWTSLRKVLMKYYPDKVQEFRDSVFNKNDFNANIEREILKNTKKYHMKVSTHFGGKHLIQTGKA